MAKLNKRKMAGLSDDSLSKSTSEASRSGEPAAHTPSYASVLKEAKERRPIRPKSLIMTIFGDSIVPLGGVVWLGSIVSMTGLFDLSESLVRTSALRLTYDGWLRREQVGKKSYYSMAEEFAVADVAYQSRIYGSSAELRMNGWTILKLFKDKIDRKTAYRMRQELDRNGFGQLAPQVFIHPSIGESAARHIASDGGKSAVGPVFFGNSALIDPRMMRHLVDTAWDLTPVREAYRNFLDAFGLLPQLLAHEAPNMEQAFALRTLMMHYYRRAALRDPRLPASVLGDDWPGEKAFELMSEVYPKLLPGSEAYLEQTLEPLPGQVFSTDVRLYRRFDSV